MTGEDFTAWLAFMKMRRLAKTDADCSRLLGVSQNTVSAWKRKGAPLYVALACAALFDGLRPWTNEHIF